VEASKRPMKRVTNMLEGLRSFNCSLNSASAASGWSPLGMVPRARVTTMLTQRAAGAPLSDTSPMARRHLPRGAVKKSSRSPLPKQRPSKTVKARKSRYIRLSGFRFREARSQEARLAPLAARRFYGISYGINGQVGGGVVMVLKDLEIKSLKPPEKP
jgi:hypothetical protein